MVGAYKIKLHTKYQRPGPSSFRKEDIKKSQYECVNQVYPGAGSFFTPGLYSPGRGPHDKTTTHQKSKA